MVGLASGLCLIKTAHYQAGNAVYDSVLNRVPEPVHLLAKTPAPRGRLSGYASVLPEGTAALNPDVKITRVFARPDPSKVREFADDVRDGKFVLPVGRRLPLRDAAEAQVLSEKSGVGKIVLLALDPQN
jgi:NADPH:quinone reductase-like Zn-dependent oxidoreductase